MNTFNNVQALLAQADKQFAEGEAQKAFRTVCEAIREAAPNPVREARAVMREAFTSDPSFKKVYLSNIAMWLYDEAHSKSPQLNYRNMEACDEMAERILTRIFQE